MTREIKILVIVDSDLNFEWDVFNWEEVWTGGAALTLVWRTVQWHGVSRWMLHRRFAMNCKSPCFRTLKIVDADRSNFGLHIGFGRKIGDGVQLAVNIVKMCQKGGGDLKRIPPPTHTHTLFVHTWSDYLTASVCLQAHFLPSWWRYSPGCALASSAICFQASRFLALSLHSFTPRLIIRFRNKSYFTGWCC
jgi:hypothetical protein